MANTITEYGYLSRDAVLKGIVKTIVYESPFLARLPFREIAGNALVYNLESTEAGINSYVTNDTWVESTTVWGQRNVALTIMGGDADVDEFAKQTRSNEQDIEAAVIELKSKALADYFEKMAILGYQSTTYTTKQFKGLMHLLAECESSTTTDWDAPSNDQIIEAGSTSATLTLDMVDQLIDLVKPKADVLVMSRRMRRKVGSLARAAGNNLVHDKDALGKFVSRYGDQEILISDWVPDNIQDAASGIITIRSYDQTTTRASTNDNSVIFALRFDENNAVAGVTNGWIQKEDIGALETKDASRTRIKFYAAMANFGKVGLAGLIAVTDGN